MKKVLFVVVMTAVAIMSHLHGADTGTSIKPETGKETKKLETFKAEHTTTGKSSDQPDWIKAEQNTRPSGAGSTGSTFHPSR